ncbi:ATP-binding protein [Nocardia sp. NPDC057353]|uniref:ATP-binding protein n=1 Tax=Nocardia sp. NPDC057353 TaxID=3346104 RepID=UPI003644AD0A
MIATDGEEAALRVEFPAAAEELPAVRSRLRGWLARAVPDADRAYDLLLAAGEACTNSVEHGHRGDRGPVRLVAELRRGEVRITVTDSGRWLPRATIRENGTVQRRGRGLALMRELTAHTRLTILESGTTVELCAPAV